MFSYRYTVCRHLPDVSKSLNDGFDYAVLTASLTGMAISGVNLSAYRLEHKDIVRQFVIANTLDLLIRKACSTVENDWQGSFLNSFNRIIGDGFDSILYYNGKIVESNQSPDQLAFTVFAELIRDKDFIGQIQTYRIEYSPKTSTANAVEVFKSVLSDKKLTLTRNLPQAGVVLKSAQ